MTSIFTSGDYRRTDAYKYIQYIKEALTHQRVEAVFSLFTDSRHIIFFEKNIFYVYLRRIIVSVAVYVPLISPYVTTFPSVSFSPKSLIIKSHIRFSSWSWAVNLNRPSNHGNLLL